VRVEVEDETMVVSMKLIIIFTFALVFALTMLILLVMYLLGMSPFAKVKKMIQPPKPLGVPEKVELNPVSKPVIEHSPTGLRFSPTHYVATGIDTVTGLPTYKFINEDETVDVEFVESDLVPVSPLKTMQHEGEDLWKIHNNGAETKRLQDLRAMQIEVAKLQVKEKIGEAEFETQLKQRVKEDRERKNILYGSTSNSPFSGGRFGSYAPYRYGFRGGGGEEGGGEGGE
jgi:uncharacterized membrane protein YgcG